MLKEFREFAVKGNMLDLAIGLIIGAAFGAIVTSLVKDIIMPPIGMLVGQVDFNELKYTLKPGPPPITINYGTFLNLIINFIIIAFAAFMIVKAFNRFKEKKEEAPPEPSKQEVLLTEIRDLLAKK